MKVSEQINKLLDKLYDKVKDLDLSADERSALIDMKLEVVGRAIKYENIVAALTKEKPCYVIKLLENDEFIGYVDYHKNDDPELPTVPALVKTIDEVENEIYPTLESALEQINIYQATADTFQELNPDTAVITYVPEQRQ